jgi:hypothetical protein
LQRGSCSIEDRGGHASDIEEARRLLLRDTDDPETELWEIVPWKTEPVTIEAELK